MFYCGWDGGGTKTRACLLNGTGTQMNEAVFGPLNPNGAAVEIVRQTIRDGVAWLADACGGLQNCGGLVVGAAGISNRLTAGLIQDTLKEAGYSGSLRLLGDHEILLAGAVHGPGAILIAGTGSVCFGRDAQGKPFRAGGYGYLIDDVGSGYALGRDILTAVVRGQDGRGKDTCLYELALDALGLKDLGGLITWLYSPETDRRKIASLAPLLADALKKNDEAALLIARKAAKELSELVLAGWKRANLTGGELAYSGSILEHFDLIRDGVTEAVHAAIPEISVIAPRHSAAQGAAMLAREYFQ